MAVSSHSPQLLGLTRAFPRSNDARKGCRGRVISCVGVDAGAASALCVNEAAAESSNGGGSSLARQLRQLNLEFQNASTKQECVPASSSSGRGTPTVRRIRFPTSKWRKPVPSSEVAVAVNGASVEGRGLVDRPKDLTANSVPVVLRLLRGVEETEGGVALAMEGWEVPLSARSMVAILNSLDKWQKALPFFNWAAAKQYDLNVYTYNVMVKLLRKGQQWELAERIVLEMIEKGVEPDNVTYSTLISFASRSNRHEEALGWYERMHEAGCVPDGITYSSVIDMYGRAGRVDEAVSLYQELRAAGWNADAVTIGTMVHMLGKAGRFSEAEKTFQELKKAGVKPSAIVYNIMIRVLGDIGKTDEAGKLIEEMILAGVQPNAITVSCLIDAYGKDGNFAECLRVYERMQRERWGCDHIVLNSVLKSCADYASEELSESIFEKMQVSGFEPTDYTYKIMLHMYSKHGSKMKAQRLFSRMVKSGFPADIVSYTSLMQAYGQAKDFERVAEIFDEMVGCGCKPDEMVWGCLFSLLVLCENDEEKRHIFGIFEKGNPELHSMLKKLVAVETQEQQLHKELQALTLRYSPGAYRRYINAIIDFSLAQKAQGRAMEILMLSVHLGAFSDIQSRSPSVWRLHLRGLSIGATRCAIEWWISSLSQALQNEGDWPTAFVIESGNLKGRWADTEQKKRDMVLSCLEERNSPFAVKSTLSEDGRDSCFLLGAGEAVRSWLQDGPFLRPHNLFEPL